MKENIKLDVALNDQKTSMVDRLSELLLEDKGLKAAFHEVLNLETKNVIELSVFGIKHAKASKTTNDGLTFEKTTLVLGVECEKLTSLGANLFKQRKKRINREVEKFAK